MKRVMLSNEEDDILMTEIDFLQQKIGLSVDRAGTLTTVQAYVILYVSTCNKTWLKC